MNGKEPTDGRYSIDPMWVITRSDGFYQARARINLKHHKLVLVVVMSENPGFMPPVYNTHLRVVWYNSRTSRNFNGIIERKEQSRNWLITHCDIETLMETVEAATTKSSRARLKLYRLIVQSKRETDKRQEGKRCKP